MSVHPTRVCVSNPTLSVCLRAKPCRGSLHAHTNKAGCCESVGLLSISHRQAMPEPTSAFRSIAVVESPSTSRKLFLFPTSVFECLKVLSLAVFRTAVGGSVPAESLNGESEKSLWKDSIKRIQWVTEWDPLSLTAALLSLLRNSDVRRRFYLCHCDLTDTLLNYLKTLKHRFLWSWIIKIKNK